MRRLTATALLICLLGTLGSVAAANAPTHPAQSSRIVGTGFRYLNFSGEPDADGLIVVFGIPKAPGFDWPFAVYNGSNHTISDLRLTISEPYQGKTYPFDDDAWVYPTIIAPGEFGFGGAHLEIDGQSIPAGPNGGLDATFTASQIKTPDSKTTGVLDLRLSNVQIDDFGGVSGTVTNSNAFDVKDIEVQRVCIEDTGILTSWDFDVLDRRLLKAHTSADFTARVASGCDSGNAYFLLAVGTRV